MTKPNYLVEMSNDVRTLRDENGISPEAIVDFLAKAGPPTHLEGRFGERSKRADGFDVAGIDKFLSRDASWFPTPETLIEPEQEPDTPPAEFARPMRLKK
jgi:hypothetical protein